MANESQGTANAKEKNPYGKTVTILVIVLIAIFAVLAFLMAY